MCSPFFIQLYSFILTLQLDQFLGSRSLQEILCDEIEDEEFLGFAIDNMEELLSDIAKGNLSIRIHRDITGAMWFRVD